MFPLSHISVLCVPLISKVPDFILDFSRLYLIIEESLDYLSQTVSQLSPTTSLALLYGGYRPTEMHLICLII